MAKHMKENIDSKAFFKIGYGLYIVTTNDGNKDNGLIVNTVTQIASSPLKIGVSISKANYSCETIEKTRKLNVNVLSEDAPFLIFKHYGFNSARDKNKFAGQEIERSSNGLVIFNNYVNSYMSLSVEQSIDVGSHILFICDVEEAKTISDKPTMTYDYYQANVKPKPDTQKKKGFVCKVCGYVYEGDTLPEDYICPLCKHGATDFEPIK